MPVTKDQAQMLATLACAMRPYGARQWDPPGVLAAIAKVADRNLASVTMAVTRAATDRTAVSPGVIYARDSIHWAERLTDPTPPTNHGPWCTHCGQAEPAPIHRSGDHAFTTRPKPADPNHVAAALTQARRALHGTDATRRTIDQSSTPTDAHNERVTDGQSSATAPTSETVCSPASTAEQQPMA